MEKFSALLALCVGNSPVIGTFNRDRISALIHCDMPNLNRQKYMTLERLARQTEYCCVISFHRYIKSLISMKPSFNRTKAANISSIWHKPASLLGNLYIGNVYIDSIRPGGV